MPWNLSAVTWRENPEQMPPDDSDSHEEYREYLKIQAARLKATREGIFRQLLGGKRAWRTEDTKCAFIEFIKETDAELLFDEEIRNLISNREKERDSLIRILENYGLITYKDLE